MSSSDDEELSANYSSESLELKGFLSKWTNYIHGWQTRYIVLKGSTLSYYKSEEESDFGCRGAIALEKALVKESEVDDCRFEIYVDNLVWYLRTDRKEDRQYWVDVLRSFRVINDEINHVTSDNLSTTSGSSLKHTNRLLQLKMNEIETYRDILNSQTSTLQRYFDRCASLNGNFTESSTSSADENLQLVDFKGEAITFRETTAAVLDSLNHCLEILAQKEESMKKKLERELEKRRLCEQELKKCQEEIIKNKAASISGPDLEAEGPNSTIPDDEFFDAVETGLENVEELCNIRTMLKLQSQQSVLAEKGEESSSDSDDDFGSGKAAMQHALWSEIDKVCKTQIHHAITGVDVTNANGWQLFAEEGEMKMYRREEEINGIVIDPLKSCHVVRGCTAREMCYYFFHPSFRNDWETTLEECKILEEISKDTLVFLQTHKRIWPANQRDALFWSHMKKINEDKETEAHDAWMVCNQSTEGPSYPAANQGKCIRIYLTVILLCQTIVAKPKNGEQLTRDDLTCKITYCSVVNPGGWVKPSLLRAVYKKEYPKFLKRFTSYVLETVKNKPIKF